MTEPPTHRDVAGLRVPIELVPRIVAAFRATYPGLTDGLDDDAATRAVLREFVTSTLAVYESRQALTEVEKEIKAKRETMEDLAGQAFEKAKTDAATITDAPVVGENVVYPSVDPPVPG